MKGNKIRSILIEKGVQQKAIADYLGISKQTLSAALSIDDVRSSLIEGIADYLDIPVSEIYGEHARTTVSAAAGGTAVAGSGNTINAQIDKFLDLLKEKDVQIGKFQDEISDLIATIKQLAK